MSKQTLKNGKNVFHCKKTNRKRVVTHNEEPSKTDGSFKKQCDAKEIIHKFKTTGHVSHIREQQGQFLDVSDVTDLHTSLITVQKAKDEFYSLPANIRKKFNNSMEDYYSFLANSDNDAEAVELGLKSWTPEAEKAIEARKKEKKDGKNNSTNKTSNQNSKDDTESSDN